MRQVKNTHTHTLTPNDDPTAFPRRTPWHAQAADADQIYGTGLGNDRRRIPGFFVDGYFVPGVHLKAPRRA